MKKLFLSIVTITAFYTAANAQATASATATATIITPISIAKTADMSFGNLSVSSTTAGSVTMSASGTRVSTGGVTLPATNGTVAAAAFTVTGNGSYTYAITLPGSVTLTRASGTETMTASSFTSTPTATGQLTAGTQNLTVGATLSVAAAQVAGVYTSGSFNVTVNYN